MFVIINMCVGSLVSEGRKGWTEEQMRPFIDIN